jgi:hypothetical protein
MAAFQTTQIVMAGLGLTQNKSSPSGLTRGPIPQGLRAHTRCMDPRVKPEDDGFYVPDGLYVSDDLCVAARLGVAGRPCVLGGVRP